MIGILFVLILILIKNLQIYCLVAKVKKNDLKIYLYISISIYKKNKMLSSIIDDYLSNLPINITKINLSNKNLKILPDLSRFQFLEILNVSFNYLTTLPKLNESIKELPILNKKIHIISVRFNNINTIRNNIAPNLTILDLGNNPIYELFNTNCIFLRE